MLRKIQLALPLLLTTIGPVQAQDRIGMYGVIDMAVVREAGGKDGAVTKLSSGVPMGSRLGIQGSEEVGDGVQAIFLLENGFQADTGETGQGGLLFGRHGGSVVTAGGLVFIGAATDNLFRAIDIRTGNTVWQDVLPAGGQASPISYEVDGEQYVLIAATGHAFMETGNSDAIIVYKLRK